jgi:hypothetical protein
LTTGQDCSRRALQCPQELPYHFLVSGGRGVSPEVAKPVPLHLGQTTKPFRLLLAQALHVPMTTQDSLRASPVPLHSGHATSRFPAQRGHCSLTSPTGIPPSCPVQSSTDTDCAQSAVSVDRLYVILAARTTPCPFLTARGLQSSTELTPANASAILRLCCPRLAAFDGRANCCKINQRQSLASGSPIAQR